MPVPKSHNENHDAVFPAKDSENSSKDEANRRPRDEQSTEKYSLYTTPEKRCIVAIVSYAAWFSTLTSFIYYPAIHQLSSVFDVSVDKINLTITTYMGK